MIVEEIYDKKHLRVDMDKYLNIKFDKLNNGSFSVYIESEEWGDIYYPTKEQMKDLISKLNQLVGE